MIEFWWHKYASMEIPLCYQFSFDNADVLTNWRIHAINTSKSLYYSFAGTLRKFFLSSFCHSRLSTRQKNNVKKMHLEINNSKNDDKKNK